MTSTARFDFAGVDLNPDVAENSIKLTASDRVVSDIECQDTVLLDYYSPEVEFSNETNNLTFSTSDNVQISGSLVDDNKVTMYAYLQSLDDTTAPSEPPSIEQNDVQQNMISISWLASGMEIPSPVDDNETTYNTGTESDDVYKYLIYRSDVPDGPVAATDKGVTDWSDENVSTATTYTYQISAIDRAGNEGEKSSPLTVTTLPNGTVVPVRSKITPPNPSMVFSKEFIPGGESVVFNERVSGLFEGSNTVRVEFVDEAGNVFEHSFTIAFDSEAPEFLSPTSSEFEGLYSPSFVSEILVAGQINKPVGEIWVWVNSVSEEPTYKFGTGDNGTFEADLPLTGSFSAAMQAVIDSEPGASSAEGSVSVGGPSLAGTNGRPNLIKMIAVDSYGRQSNPLEATVQYTPCGTNTYWSVKLLDGGSVLNSRELLEGLSAYGFGFELEWIGGGDPGRARVQKVDVDRAPMGANDLKNYDFDWIPTKPIVMCNDPRNCTKGFVLINFAAQNREGETYLEKEQNISQNRVGECFPLVGCVKLLLELEIVSDPGPFTSQYGDASDGTYGQAYGAQQIEPQKQCVALNVMIDERIPIGEIGFVREILKGSLVAINATLEFIDLIEIPLKYVTQITIGICMFSYISKFITEFLKSYNCRWSGALKNLGAGDSLLQGLAEGVEAADIIPKIARMHNEETENPACSAEFGEGEEKKDLREACEKCAKWIDKVRWVNDKYHLFCDRISCPAVPSLQHYVTDNYERERATPWMRAAEQAAQAARRPARTCAPFNPDPTGGGGSQLPTSTSCGCNSAQANCGPSTDTEASICYNNNCIQPITDNCTLNQPAIANCRCNEKVCVIGQTCGASGCSGRVSGQQGTTPTEEPATTEEAAPAEESTTPTEEESTAEEPAGAGNEITNNAITGFVIAGTDMDPATPPQGFDDSCDDDDDCPDRGDIGMECRGQKCAVTSSSTGNYCTRDEHCDTGDCVEHTCIGITNAQQFEAMKQLEAEQLSADTIEAMQEDINEISDLDLDEMRSEQAVEQRTSERNAMYSEEIYYQQGDYDDFGDVDSDCEFVVLDRNTLSDMWDFYNTNKKTPIGEYCSGNHVPQPACCPFEYMNEWGWGMMFSNEVKQSYCLSHPEDSEVCGFTKRLVNGVTGICQPEGEQPRAIPVILNGLQWANNYPVSSSRMQHQDVMYLVDLDESGSVSEAKRGYIASGIRSVGERDESGRVEISTGTFFEPEPGQQDISSFFPARDASNPGNDADGFDTGLEQFKSNLAAKIQSHDIVMLRGREPTPALYEEWYRQIYGLIGDPGRQYLAQPSGSFVQSLVTLCLSTIYAWMLQFKSILLQFQTCFQSIVATGDGSAGQCRAIISQYICDLIYEAISCIRTKFGMGGSARVSAGGVGGFFSALSDAGRIVSEDAQSRYADRNMFGSVFSAQNIMHDACVFMFTGEWPTDFGAIFEQAAIAPINSTVLLFPVTRRWQAYNPSTGFSRFTYHIAYTIFAGADIHYSLKLECSGQDTYCEFGDNGVCDCGHQGVDNTGRQTWVNVPTHGDGDCPDNGDLIQGESCTDEIMFVGQGYYPLRYDRAVVEFVSTQSFSLGGTGRSSHGIGGSITPVESISGRRATEVNEIFAPPEMYNCGFDIGTYSFRCGFDVPAHGFARFIGEPDLINEEGRPYGIGDNAIARVRVQQELPAGATSCSGDCEFTKYMVVKEIINGRGAQIYPEANKEIVGERLNQAGSHTFLLFDDDQFPQHVNENDGGFEIKADHFGEASPGVCRAEASLQPRDRRMPRRAIRRSGSSSSSGVDCSNVDSEYDFGMQIIIEGNTHVKYQIAEYNEELRRYSLSSSATIRDCEDIEEDEFENYDTYDCDGARIHLLTEYMESQGTITTMGGTRDETASVPSPIIGVMFDAPDTTDTPEDCVDNPETWRMTVELRDSESIGGSGYQMASIPANDLDTGEIQSVNIPFPVVCSEGTGSLPDSGSLEDLSRRTAILRAENTRDNNIFGMWIEPNRLGPSESISVSDFEWINEESHAEGFRITIDPDAEYGILNIDVGRIRLSPSQDMRIVKQGNEQEIQYCGSGTCIEDYGSENNRVIKMRLGPEDPVFEFSGFRATSDLEQSSAEGFTLSLRNPEYPTVGDPIVTLQNPRLHDELTVFFSDYRQDDDGFSIDFKTEPAPNLDPVTVSFNMNKMGYRTVNPVFQVNKINIPECIVDSSAPAIQGRAVSPITGMVAAVGRFTGHIYTSASSIGDPVSIDNAIWKRGDGSVASSAVI
ncbi:fibronectin type III domain-containing protein, partial [Candidatus Woesearchaeota archaeon]|nr:fibronectin type III domain-containing protein [Candidatus Woesearchaeota archaeon]